MLTLEQKENLRIFKNVKFIVYWNPQKHFCVTILALNYHSRCNSIPQLEIYFTLPLILASTVDDSQFSDSEQVNQIHGLAAGAQSRKCAWARGPHHRRHELQCDAGETWSKIVPFWSRLGNGKRYKEGEKHSNIIFYFHIRARSFNVSMYPSQ